MHNNLIKLHEAIISDIKKYINDNIYDRNTNAINICRMSGYSTQYMHRLFRKMTSKSILQYINEVRMEKTRHLLINTDMTVTEISRLFGFTSLSDLTKRFKKKYGQPPSLFRQLHKKKI
ncbi:helix-turn-helix transcriptional regulator [Cronobacter malonaticus]|nr:helix-turn-helix transcriptional regulator [Cronobacter malonaticus]